MKPSAQQYLLWFCVLWVLFWGCHGDTSEADPVPVDQAMALLTQLTSTKESERFKAQAPAIHHMGAISHRELETVLTSLRKKNVSALIYVCIKTGNDGLYKLSPPAVMVLESAAGAFPNIAYYYARVRPSSGLEKLFRLYHRYPANRLPICLALGELDRSEAHRFLLAEARKIKTAGKGVYAHLCGLKSAADVVGSKDVFWMLDQKLDREEIIALAQVGVQLSDAQLKTLWQSGAARRNYALQSILGDPEAYFNVLCWVMNQYLDIGDSDIARQLLLSDSLRLSSSRRVQQYRKTVLQKIGTLNKGLD
jgi:hypothetical protein